MRKLIACMIPLSLVFGLTVQVGAFQEQEKSNNATAAKAVPALKVIPAEKSEDDKKKEKKKTPKNLKPTHKQTKSFVPRHKGEKVKLHTFCLNESGEVLAVVGGKFAEAVFKDGKYEMKTTQTPALLQVYNHQQKLVNEIPLDFSATAINIDKSGFIYLAGDGKIAKLNAVGETIKSISSPSLKDEKELREQITAQMEKQYKEYVATSEKQIKTIKEKIEAIEEVEEEERTKRQVRQLKSFKQQITMLEQNRDSLKSFYEPTDERIEQSLQQAKEIKSIAINDKDVFVTCAAPGTYGYEIWRVNKELDEPERVLENVSGCCGQMDIQARGEHLYVAENTKFQVAIYDRDGKQINKFGKRAMKGDQAGWGSCCNPMNIRCCNNGEVLAAESSIGNIKRYDADGELISFVGRAKIGGGCKHVAIGHDTKHDIYYMMYQDEGSICVMEPAAKVGLTSAEKAAKEASEGLGKKIVGDWVWEKAGEEKPKKDTDLPAGAVSIESLTAFKSMSFNDSGKFAYKASGPAGFGFNLNFKPVKQDGKTLWMDLADQEDIIMMSVVVKFVDEDKIEAEIKYSSMPATKRVFVRKKADKKEEKDSSK